MFSYTLGRLALLFTISLVLLASACGSDAESGTESSSSAEPEQTVSVDTDPVASSEGLNTDLFLDGALSGEPTIVDCTLSDGTETSCHSLTVAGSPADHDIGPFCPPTTASTADEGGIWFDGNGA